MNLLKNLFKKKDNLISETSQSGDKNIVNLEDYKKSNFLYVFKERAMPENWKYSLFVTDILGISNTKQFLSEMIQQGYLEKASLELKLNTYTVKELKLLLKSKSLKTTGKKQEQIERLLNNCDSEYLEKLFHTNYYTLSEKGKIFVNDHSDEWMIGNHQKWNIDFAEFAKEKEKDPDKSFYDICWKIFNSRTRKEDPYISRNNYYDMYELLMEEKRYDYAFEELLRVIYIDVSGMGIRYDINSYHNGFCSKKDVLENCESAILIAPGLITDLEKLKNWYKPEMIENIYRWKLPIQICDKTLFKDMIEAVINERFDLIYYKNELYKCAQKYIKQVI